MSTIRCGRCIAQDHAECVGSIRMGPLKAAYTWRCDCPCQANARDASLPTKPAHHSR